MSKATEARRCPKCKAVTERYADGKCAVCSRRRAGVANRMRSVLSIGRIGRPKK
jgi:hypothetical protein